MAARLHEIQELGAVNIRHSLAVAQMEKIHWHFKQPDPQALSKFDPELE